MSTARPSDTAGAMRGNVIIGAASVLVGAAVIPYGAAMPYVREGIPGPGLFPMMIGGLLVLFGALLILTSVLTARRERRHRDELAEIRSAAAGGPSTATTAVTGGTAPTGAGGPGADSAADALEDAAPETGPQPSPDTEPEAEPPETVAVMDTDIGSDGARRWINGAILMGGIVGYVLLVETLGFPLTMALLVTAIVWSLRAKWWVAVATGVVTALALWAMFEQGLMVQLPDGIIRGF
ncbi:tripartite tricarboxylate transporter TctB family protein [Brachybacterium sp. GCM10030267]|uniref:tripartite tricarboxylate transporter TctB family protein n=1 Tax=unclassified Brachybacterium TaxID=2623841 RepID=UPI003622097F